MQPGAEGQIIASKYRLLRKLGQGGMGSVWLAQHLTLHSPVAIKLIEPAIAQNAEALSRFLREAQAAASLRSPHVVQILDHGVDDGVPYIAMELLEGESLADRLSRVQRLSPAETTRIMTHVSRAIVRAHEAGIVHRDLKPDNIYLVRNDDEEIAKVLDFGIAKSTSQGLAGSVSGNTRTGAMLGTPYYMSPEQAEGMRSLDYRADIWALGVICFECLVGRRPFDAETLGSLLLAICTRPIPIPSQLGPVPAGFDAWFARACARDPSQRFASAKEAALELRRVCDGGAPVQTHSSLPNVSGLGGMSSPGFVPAVTGPKPPSLSGFSATGAGEGLASTAGLPKKSSAGLVVVLALFGLALIGGGAFALTHRGGSAPSSAASNELVPSPSAPVSSPAAVVPEVVPQVGSAAVPVAPAPAEAVSAAAAAATAHAASKPAKPGKTSKPSVATAPSPAAPAPPQPPAPSKPKINLGI